MNLTVLSRAEILKRYNFKCVHGHRGTAHPRCYEQANCLKERIGFVDIETSNLKADYAIIFSWCILEDGDKGKLYKRVLTPEEMKSGIYDKNSLREFIETVKTFDRVVGYYSGDGRFDLPILRTRSIYWNLDFPTYKTIKQNDLYTMVKYKLNLHSRRLGAVCEFFKIPSKEHRMTPLVWLKAMSGNKKALAYILRHNIEDVVSTKKLWHKISKYSNLGCASI